MLCITIASAPPRREIALLSLACIRKKGDIKDELYCIVYCIPPLFPFNLQFLLNLRFCSPNHYHDAFMHQSSCFTHLHALDAPGGPQGETNYSSDPMSEAMKT